jgi:hypothetical protein
MAFSPSLLCFIPQSSKHILALVLFGGPPWGRKSGCAKLTVPHCGTGHQTKGLPFPGIKVCPGACRKQNRIILFLF